jgi:hypothetical protein
LNGELPSETRILILKKLPMKFNFWPKSNFQYSVGKLVENCREVDSFAQTRRDHSAWGCTASWWYGVCACFQRYAVTLELGREREVKASAGFNTPWKQESLENVIHQLFPDQSIIK